MRVGGGSSLMGVTKVGQDAFTLWPSLRDMGSCCYSSGVTGRCHDHHFLCTKVQKRMNDTAGRIGSLGKQKCIIFICVCLA